jgi:hypothetical protein
MITKWPVPRSIHITAPVTGLPFAMYALLLGHSWAGFAVNEVVCLLTVYLGFLVIPSWRREKPQRTGIDEFEFVLFGAGIWGLFALLIVLVFPPTVPSTIKWLIPVFVAVAGALVTLTAVATRRIVEKRIGQS